MNTILTEIWCRFYLDGAETNIDKKLEIIRTIISYGGPEDIALFNYWAGKIGYPVIDSGDLSKSGKQR